VIDLARIGALAVEVMLPLSLLVAAGGLWPRWFPDTDVEWLRNQLSRLTMYLFYPAILFSVAMVTPISRELLAVPVVTALAAAKVEPAQWSGVLDAIVCNADSIEFARVDLGRAPEAVLRSLTLLGASEAQIEAVSFGKERPAATGSDEAAYAKNRRVELANR
jgi:predicted membrane metal-binding protein